MEAYEARSKVGAETVASAQISADLQGTARHLTRNRFQSGTEARVNVGQARMYEEARVIEVRRRQREVYERIKARPLFVLSC